jgi:hypothetical protein
MLMATLREIRPHTAARQPQADGPRTSEAYTRALGLAWRQQQTQSASVNLTAACEPSQKGLLPERPQGHSA